MASLTEHNVFKVHPCGLSSLFLFFFFFIPFYGWISFHCMDTPHFVYLFISWWHVSSFHFADVNVCVQVSVWTYIFSYLGCISRSGIAGLYGNFKVLRNRHCFSTMAAPFSIPSSWVWGLQCLFLLANTCYCSFLHDSLASGCEVISHCGLGLCLPND